MKNEQAVVLFGGRVQGVGFRYTCRSLAMGFSVTGYVKNLEDRRVELVMEGERPEVEGFLKAIREGYLKPFIRECVVEWYPATGNWKDFHIAY